MKYFEVQLETKSHSDAPGRVHRTVIMGRDRDDVDAACRRMDGIESWGIIREMTQEQVRTYYGD